MFPWLDCSQSGALEVRDSHKGKKCPQKEALGALTCVIMVDIMDQWERTTLEDISSVISSQVTTAPPSSPPCLSSFKQRRKCLTSFQTLICTAAVERYVQFYKYLKASGQCYVWLRHVTKCCLKSVIQSLLIPMCFLGSITALAAWGGSRTVCRPQQSLHFQHCRSFASVSLAKTGITSFHWTVHSTVWFGYKKWPLPLVKHQRRPITCKITLQSSRLWWVPGFDQWEHSVLTLQTNERTESLADLWSVKESVGSVCLNFLWWKLNN